MNKEQLVSAIKERVDGITIKEINDILSALTEVISDQVANGEKVTLVGFGTFEARKRQARTGRNPKTGQPLQIPETTVPAFAPGKQFKEKVAGG